MRDVMSLFLVGEDEPRRRADLVDVLPLSGLAATRVAAARDLRRVLADGDPPAVFLLDVGLPDGNGFDLAAEIRSSHDCGIITLTALDDSVDRIRRFDRGPDIYLVKDSPTRELEAAIRRLLRRTRTTGTTP